MPTGMGDGGALRFLPDETVDGAFGGVPGDLPRIIPLMRGTAVTYWWKSFLSPVGRPS